MRNNKDYQEYLEELVMLQESKDVEGLHLRADSILVEILLDLGYVDIVNVYEKLDKWYA